MGVAVLQVAGRRYEIACRDGEEKRLEALGRKVDAKAQSATAGMGNVNEVRQLLFAALLLADELGEGGVAPPPEPAPAAGQDPEMAALLVAIADHLEATADRLENGGAGA